MHNHCKACAFCTDYYCGDYCSLWCNKWTTNMVHCRGCDATRALKLAPSVAALPTCYPAGAPTFTISSAITGKTMTASQALGTDAAQTVFQTNCGKPNFPGIYALAAGAVETTTAFGALSMSAASSGDAPGGIASAGDATYIYTADGSTPADGGNHMTTLSPCNYNGDLAYCLLDYQMGYDYDGVNGNDKATYCFAFKEGKYCDGKVTNEMVHWKVRNGIESFGPNYPAGPGYAGLAVPSPFTGAYSDATSYIPGGNHATFLCQTNAKMPPVGTVGFSVAGAVSSTDTGCKRDLCGL